ncbi:MAG: PAS domain S-box protein [Chloroflexi bacterium]|nr:PAS domain S-box protein [Chloroflexota bacterium]
MIGTPGPTRDTSRAIYVLASIRGTAAEFLEAVPDAVVVTESDGRVVFMNTHAEDLLGYAPEECVGWAVEMLLPEGLRRAHEAAREQHRADGQPTRMASDRDLVARQKDGREIPVEIGLSPLATDSGVLIIATIRDVSKRQRAEEELLQGERTYRLLVENARDVVYRLRLGPPRAFDYMSPAVTRITGFTPEDYYADPTLSRRQTHPDDTSFADAIVASPRALEEPFAVHVVAQDGAMSWLEFHNTPVLDDGGAVVAIEGIARDVTHRRSVEEALRESEARLLAAIENLPFGFWAYDAVGRCFMQNPACKERWGDRNGMRIDEIPMDGAVAERWQDTRRRAMAGEVVHKEEPYTSDGEQRLDYTIAAPIRRGETITGVLGVNIDITERHRAQELEVRLRAAEESERLKDALLGTVSHELRSPISVIHGCATTAIEYADRLSPDEILEHFQDIDRATLRLERMVSDLLVMSRLDAGALRMDLQPMGVQSVVQEAVRVIATTATRRDVRTSFASRDVKVRCDADRILQVLSNLLENADKFSPEGAPVEVSVEPMDAAFVKVSVRDGGPGVAQQELDAIFDRFYRSSSRGRAPAAGAGLGLAICRSIIQAHGGRIWASLPADGGLQITFSLPRV